MALYIPAGRRRRNALLLALATLVAGLVLGYLVGRAGEPSVADAVATAQQRADDLATQLERLPIEYQQGLAGAGDNIQEGVLQPLDELQRSAIGLFDDAPWVSSAERAATLDAIAAVKVAAESTVPAAEFERLVSVAASDLRGLENVTAP